MKACRKLIDYTLSHFQLRRNGTKHSQVWLKLWEERIEALAIAADKELREQEAPDLDHLMDTDDMLTEKDPDES